MTKRTAILALGTALATAGVAQAQDDGLYPEPSSPDASFVRVIAPEAESAEIGGTEVEVTDTGVTSYVEVSLGEIDMTLGDTEEMIEVGANTHYTYLGGENAGLIQDAVKDSPAQADLLLYNLSGLESFDLYAVEAETAALSDIAQGAHDGVGLKAPLTLTFEIRQDGETLAAVDPVDLRRGTATTIILSGEDAGTLSAAATTSTYE